MPLRDQAEFLNDYQISDEEFTNSNIAWGELSEIYDQHIENTPNLNQIAEYIAGTLRNIDGVHSIRMRVKHPEHLIAKIVRKRSENSERVITLDNYRTEIKDLIGIRALHLFKAQWSDIHTHIEKSWTLKEKFAYIRKGDNPAFNKYFEEAGLGVEEHPQGYRSIHYILETQPAKEKYFAELQVRTIFEEAWGEVDHQVRYPNFKDDKRLEEFSMILNRLAGSADEMSSFVLGLRETISALETAALNAEEARRELADEIAQMRQKNEQYVQQLKLSHKEKEELLRRLNEIPDIQDKSSEPDSFKVRVGGPVISTALAAAIRASAGIDLSPDVSGALYFTSRMLRHSTQPKENEQIEELRATATCGADEESEEASDASP